MFPKTAAVLGAHTELGKFVVRELLRSPYIVKVHALAEVDLRDGISMRPRDNRKLVLHLDPLDYIEEIVSRYIPECDLAFCVLGCGKKDMAAMGAYQFHKTNLDIPRRFIHEMFALGVERIALLSHAAASPKARGSEFLRVKGELELIVKELQDEAGEHAPGVTIFKVPLMLTNLKDANGIRGTSITIGDKFKQKAALKLEAGPSQAVHVRDLAKAMVGDMVYKLHMAEASSHVEAAFRRRDIRYDEMSGKRAVDLANERRTLQREYNSKLRQQLSFDHRISQYARKHARHENLAPSSTRYSSTQSGDSVAQSGTSGTPSEHEQPNEDNSNESFMSGTPPDEDDGDSAITFGEETAAYHGGGAILGQDERPGPHSPLPSSEPRRFANEGRSGLASGSFHSPERRRRSNATVTSVDALGQQLGRRLTVIRENDYLPDVDETSVQHLEGHSHAHDSDRQFSHPAVTNPSQTPEQQFDSVLDDTGNTFKGESRDPNDLVHSHTPSLPSPPSRSLSFEVQHDSPPRPPEAQGYQFDSLPRRHSIESRDRSPSYSRPYSRNRENRYPEFYTSGGLYQRHSNYRGGITSERSEDRPSSVITRLTTFAERIMAATDRPSVKRRDRLPRRQSSRGNGDMRPTGETTI